MEISFSEIQAYQRCPRKYYYGSVMKLQRKAVALPLAQGIMVHRMMQGFYMDGSLGLEAEVDVMVAEYQDNPFVLDDDLVTFEDLMMESEALVEAYLEYYDEDRGWEVLHVEEQFSIELGRHTITFTPDLIVRDASGQVWIVDHKTAASLPDPGVPFGELQAMMYLAAVRDLYPEVAGFIFNYIRKSGRASLGSTRLLRTTCRT
jgi:RecB family exonuclease